VTLVKRRDLLRAAGAATAIAILPRHAEAAWARVRAGYRPAAGLTDAQRSLVGAIADVIFPRTDTPGATDVGVTDWVNLIVAEYYPDDVRTEFVSGLDAMDANVRAEYGRSIGDLDANARVAVVAALDATMAPGGRGGRGQAADSASAQQQQARAAYRRLKGLVVHGYFTSQRVERDVLRVRTSFPSFQGAAEHRPGAAR
jgi:hypothetical protein